MTLLDKARRALALIPAVIVAAVPAAAQDAPDSGWRSIWLHESGGDRAGLLRTARSAGAIAPWVSASDFPADLPTGNGSGYVTLRISIDATDRIAGCEVTPTLPRIWATGPANAFDSMGSSGTRCRLMASLSTAWSP